MLVTRVVLSALLLWSAYPHSWAPEGVSVGAWVFALPFLSALEPLRSRGLLKAAGLGFVFGLVLYTLLFWWLFPYSPPGAMAFILLMALQPAVFAGLFALIVPREETTGTLALVPAVWVVSEGLRERLLFGLTAGLAHTQAFHDPFLQSTAFWGPSGLAFGLMAANTALWRAWRRKAFGDLLVVVGIVALIGGVGRLRTWDAGTEPRSRVRVGILQSRVPSDWKTAPERLTGLVSGQVGLARACGRREPPPDWIVWPETSVPTDFLDDPDLHRRLLGGLRGTSTIWLVGAVRVGPRGRHNSAIWLDGRGRVLGFYDKRVLVPFAEFRPWGLGKGSADFIPGDRPGRRRLVLPRAGRAVDIGVLICAEDALGRLIAADARAGVDAEVVLVNDDWFPSSEAAVVHLLPVILHAASLGVPVVRGANGAGACLLDAYGRVVWGDFARRGSPACPVLDLPVGRVTWFRRTGDVFFWGSLAFVIMMALSMRWGRRRRDHEGMEDLGDHGLGVPRGRGNGGGGRGGGRPATGPTAGHPSQTDPAGRPSRGGEATGPGGRP